jgi:acetyl-CoA synthetase
MQRFPAWMLTTRCAKKQKPIRRFWAKLARENLHWHKPFETVLDETDAPFYKWFEDGLMNVSYNCLDVNLQKGNGDKVAVISRQMVAKSPRLPTKNCITKSASLRMA